MLYYSIFQQLFKFIPRYRFDKKSDETSGNRCCKHFSAWRQFLTCLYAQITGKDSLRDLRLYGFRLHHVLAGHPDDPAAGRAREILDLRRAGRQDAGLGLDDFGAGGKGGEHQQTQYGPRFSSP